MSFEFATARDIAFGAGTRHTVGARARHFGRAAFLVHGRDAARARWLIDALPAAGVSCASWALGDEPTVDDARDAAAQARAFGADVVVALGGGSAIDLGKAVAALLGNGGDPLDYLEVIGHGRPLGAPSVPFIAVPTTAGTGAEVTRNAVLASPAHAIKVSMRSPLMLPALAVVDPDLTLGLPPAITAATGMDALTQLIEPFLSVRANPLTDALCCEGMTRAARALRRVFNDGGDREARTDMSLASLLGGLALANAGLGAAHGFAAPIGGQFHAPHGAVCAALLPAVLRVNHDAVQQRAAGGQVEGRFTTVARLLTGNASATAADGIRWVEQLVGDLGIPPLAHYGVRDADTPALVAAAARSSSMRGNPVVLDDTELRRILTLAR